MQQKTTKQTILVVNSTESVNPESTFYNLQQTTFSDFAFLRKSNKTWNFYEDRLLADDSHEIHALSLP